MVLSLYSFWNALLGSKPSFLEYTRPEMLTYVLVRSVIDLSDPANSESGNSWFGLGPPLVIGIAFMLLGALLMLWWSRGQRAFFRKRAQVFHGGD